MPFPKFSIAIQNNRRREIFKSTCVNFNKFFVIFSLLFFSNNHNVNAAVNNVQDKSRITPISQVNNGELGNGSSFSGSMSSDGRFIVFLSNAKNLVKSDQNTTIDLFVYDRLTNELQRPIESVNFADISADGRFIAFIKGDRIPNAYIFDSLTGKTSDLSRDFEEGQFSAPINIHGISGDGRFTLLNMEHEYLNSKEHINGKTNLFLFDRVAEYFRPITPTIEESTAEMVSGLNTLSEDGRTIASLIASPEQDRETKTQGIVFYNRILDQASILHLPISENDNDFRLIDIDLSEHGDICAYLISRDNGQTTDYNLQIYYRREETLVEILNFTAPSGLIPENSLSVSLSNDGKYLAAIAFVDNEIQLSKFNLETGDEHMIDQGLLTGPIKISSGGRSILYNKLVDGISQVYIWEEQEKWMRSHILAGKVTDAVGKPLGLVALKDNQGHTFHSDQEGNFWTNGIRPGEVSIFPSKDGYLFFPEKHIKTLVADTRDINFQYTHEGIINEAKLDLGMPYSQNRGSSGPYHGFSAGYCTDLILDSFSWGVDFNIQFALDMDYRANPWHFYRWRDARDAHDMWRYFSYSNQMFSHLDDYQIGDIVFFDWNQDREIDHVALVSEIDHRNRPVMMYDATGVINSNPSGLAAELPWEPFHEQTVRGFARWSGIYEPVITDLPPGKFFQVAIGGSNLEVRILDSHGNAISADENDIHGGRFVNLNWEQVISIGETLSARPQYLIVIRNMGIDKNAYQFTSQFIQDGLVTSRIEMNGILGAGEIGRFPIYTNLQEDGQMKIEFVKPHRRIDGKLVIH